MLKLYSREMKSLSRILSVCLCCVPVWGTLAAPVASTAGNNLTAYNPSTAYNNQWATVSNGRYDAANMPSAKADFGNCNALILRCAQPKCGNGGCTDPSVAATIVNGCVKSNPSCKQYGDDLISFMSAQLVANSNAKLNEQKLALEQAKIQADAQANAASNNSEQLSALQNQIAQMQQQMESQQRDNDRALQDALATQSAQQQQALDAMKVAATDAAMQNESGITAYQQEAIDRGLSNEVMMRQTMTGQIYTKIKDAEASLKKMNDAMQTAFTYAKCDKRGNNCEGPKRVKKWRELAIQTLEPYDQAVENIYDALLDAQIVGVDLSQIYMMLSDSCSQWAKFLCPSEGEVFYPENDTDGFNEPKVCSAEAGSVTTINQCVANAKRLYIDNPTPNQKSETEKAIKRCFAGCRPCKYVENLTDKASIYQGWIDVDNIDEDNRVVVACSSGVLKSYKLFNKLSKNRNGSGVIDREQMDTWLNQVEPDKDWTHENDKGDEKKYPSAFCLGNVAGDKPQDPGYKTELQKTVLSKIVTPEKLCIDNIYQKNSLISPDVYSRYTPNATECPYVHPMFAICDVHQYNVGIYWDKDHTDRTLDSEAISAIKEMIGLKTTVISQQLYKQYEYLKATIRRIQIQLEKSVLMANLEAAGGKSDGSSESGGSSGTGTSDKSVKLTGALNCGYQTDFTNFATCMTGNIQTIIRAVDGSDRKNACKQLQNDLATMLSMLGAYGVSNYNKDWNSCNNFLVKGADGTYTGKGITDSCGSNKKEEIRSCVNQMAAKLSAAQNELKNRERAYSVFGNGGNFGH